MITSIKEFKQYKSGAATRAYQELMLLGMLEGEYNQEISKCILDLCELFGMQGHSGFTAPYVIDMFTKLASNKTLTPITSDPKEWNDVSCYSDDEPNTIWQNNRDCSYFSYDMGKTWKSVDEKIIIKKINESILVPRNLEGRAEKLKQIIKKTLKQEIIDGDITFDKSFEGIDPKDVKVKQINGDVTLILDYIPSWMRFIIINGYFNAQYNNLTSLEGCPMQINGNFYCGNNKLKSLKYGPEHVGGNYDCTSNYLTNLDGCTKDVVGNFACHSQKTDVILEKPELLKCKNFFPGIK